MDSKEKTIISVQATINAPIEKVWKNWTNPETITRWNNASDEWFTPRAENDLRVGGKFLSRMESKDGRSGFDFEAETTNSLELQRGGWQAILNNFKKYTETS
jgi:uncharacterized protein YndB with AHSA1/START domain